ncbi:MAG: hypothetical protein R3F59_32565 [Myxococcota bacterium]
MRALPWAAVLAAACEPPLATAPRDLLGDGAEEVPPRPVADLWGGEVSVGARVTVGPLVVTSPRDIDLAAFFAAAPEGGPRSGVRVVLGPAIDDWPLPVGTGFTATGTLVQRRPPVLWITAAADLAALDVEAPDVPVEPVVPAVLEGPDDDLRYALCVAPALTVTSTPDPLGHADSTVVPLAARFGLVPGYAREGDLTGILGDDGRLSARSADDWTGDLLGDLPFEGLPLWKVDGVREGTPLVLDDLVLATPWSRDLRWAVVQDAEGRGLWVDQEGWSVWQRVAPTQVGRWTVEVRYDEIGVYLRTWIAPKVRGTRPVAVQTHRDEGAMVYFGGGDLGPPDAYGVRTAGVLTLDDRFVDLSELPEGSAVAGIGAVRGGVVAPVSIEAR